MSRGATPGVGGSGGGGGGGPGYVAFASNGRHDRRGRVVVIAHRRTAARCAGTIRARLRSTLRSARGEIVNSTYFSLEPVIGRDGRPMPVTLRGNGLWSWRRDVPVGRDRSRAHRAGRPHDPPYLLSRHGDRRPLTCRAVRDGHSRSSRRAQVRCPTPCRPMSTPSPDRGGRPRRHRPDRAPAGARQDARRADRGALRQRRREGALARAALRRARHLHRRRGPARADRPRPRRGRHAQPPARGARPLGAARSGGRRPVRASAVAQARGVERILAAAEKANEGGDGREQPSLPQRRRRRSTRFVRGGELGKLMGMRAGAYRRRVQDRGALAPASRRRPAEGVPSSWGCRCSTSPGWLARLPARRARERHHGARTRGERRRGVGDRAHRVPGRIHRHDRRARQLRRRGPALVVRAHRHLRVGAAQSAAARQGNPRHAGRRLTHRGADARHRLHPELPRRTRALRRGPARGCRVRAAARSGPRLQASST